MITVYESKKEFFCVKAAVFEKTIRQNYAENLEFDSFAKCGRGGADFGRLEDSFYLHFF